MRPRQGSEVNNWLVESQHCSPTSLRRRDTAPGKACNLFKKYRCTFPSVRLSKWVPKLFTKQWLTQNDHHKHKYIVDDINQATFRLASGPQPRHLIQMYDNPYSNFKVEVEAACLFFPQSHWATCSMAWFPLRMVPVSKCSLPEGSLKSLSKR